MFDQATEGGFRLTMMYHPSHHVSDLSEMEEFFQRVFGRRSRPMAEMYGDRPRNPDYPSDYSTFTPIADVLFDTIDPKKYVLGGKQMYKTVDTPHLKGFGWYVDGMPDCYRAIRTQGIGMVGQLDQIADGDDPPTSAGSPMPLFFTVPEDAGLRYEFMPPIPFPLDPRIKEGWVLPPVSDDDPLGIEFCSHHTVLTDQPERALKLIVDALGGKIIHQGRDTIFGATGSFIQLSDSILEYSTPDEGTDAYQDWKTTAPNDTYHSITWKVVDLDRVARHLEKEGVGIRKRTTTVIIADRATAMGVPWAFTTELLPGDARA